MEINFNMKEENDEYCIYSCVISNCKDKLTNLLIIPDDINDLKYITFCTLRINNIDVFEFNDELLSYSSSDIYIPLYMFIIPSGVLDMKYLSSSDVEIEIETKKPISNCKLVVSVNPNDDIANNDIEYILDVNTMVSGIETQNKLICKNGLCSLKYNV